MIEWMKNRKFFLVVKYKSIEEDKENGKTNKNETKITPSPLSSLFSCTSQTIDLRKP